jgi:hypothetical protein
MEPSFMAISPLTLLSNKREYTSHDWVILRRFTADPCLCRIGASHQSLSTCNRLVVEVNGSMSEVGDGVRSAIRLLSRSHRRFIEEQKVKVFRSLIKETRITPAGIELEIREVQHSPANEQYWSQSGMRA